MRRLASLLMIGPITELRSMPSPTFISSAAFFNAASSGSAASPTATTTLVATQRSPAHPNEDDMIVLAAERLRALAIRACGCIHVLRHATRSNKGHCLHPRIGKQLINHRLGSMHKVQY